MTQILKLKDASSTWRKFITALRTQPQEGIVQDEKEQPIAYVLPAERYESYQAYLRQRGEDFAIFDEIAEQMKAFDPDEIQARIDQAVEEVKAKSRTERQPI